MYKVLGTHTYLGGMTLGLKTNISKVLGSYENWEPGIIASKSIGNNVFDFNDPIPKADITVGNPPCSRFSQMTYSHMMKKPELYDDFTKFEELNDVIETGKQSLSKVIWWETGPLSWGKGQSFFEGINSHLAEYWGQCTTLVIRYDLLWSGIPQNRPRCHIIHMNTNTPPPYGWDSKHPNDYTVLEWLKEKTKGYNFNYQFENKQMAELGYSPNQFVKHANKNWTFHALKPNYIFNNQRHTGSVLSGRFFVNEPENRYLDLLEYAALQSYPLDGIEKIVSGIKRSSDAVSLLSKCVSPTASNEIFNNIVQPWMENVAVNNTVQHEYRDGIYYLDLKPKGIIKSKWNDGVNSQKKVMGE